MGSKTGGNTEPMPFVRKWGAAASGGEEEPEQHSGSAPPPPGSYDPLANEYAGPAPPPPDPETPSSSSRKRDRSRSRDRKKDRKRDRSRSRDRRRRSRSREKRSKRSRSRSRDRKRSRSRDRRSRSRSPRDRRSRSKDRKREKTPEPPGPAPAPIIREPIINPLLRAEVVAEITGAPAPEALDQAMALVPMQPRKKERKSRWSEHKSFVPGMPTILPADLPDDQRIAYLLQMEIEDATRKLRLGDFAGPADPAQRSPSPEPIYDANGKRLNTRDVRKRQEMEQFRHEKIQQLMKINPNYRPPTDYRAPNIKLHDKVWIPQEAHPELNFVGLLIGPRGNTLKSLEMETGAKIIIRGKGSIKEGKLANRMGPMPGENEPLHAYVTAGDQATIKKACDRIRQIIAEATCIPDGQNALRQLQLRELALLNGTFRPEDLLNSTRCSNCGSDEHKSWECPEAPNVTANIICTACGCAGHIARDCKNPRPGGAAADMGMPDFASMDSEYSALMEELGEKPKAAPMPVDPKTQAQPFQLPGTGKGPGGYNNRGGPGGFNPFDQRGGFNPFEQHRQQAAAYAAQSSAAYDQTPAGFYASPGAQRGKNNPYSAGGWYGQAGAAPMPVPVPPPPPPMGGFPPPPPPPPPVPAADLSRLLSAAPPPPPPQ